MLILPNSPNSRVSRGRGKVLFGRAAAGIPANAVFLIATGSQSNGVSTQPDDGRLTFPANTWQYGYSDDTEKAATVPLDTPDPQQASCGYLVQLARRIRTEYPLNKIVIINGNQGSTGFFNDYWTVGGTGYVSLRDRVNAYTALYPSTQFVTTFLWWGGENDATYATNDLAGFEADQEGCFAGLRSSINEFSDTTPIVVCGLSPAAAYDDVNAALLTTPSRVTNSFHASSANLNFPDNTHATCASSYVMGDRIADLLYFLTPRSFVLTPGWDFSDLGVFRVSHQQFHTGVTTGLNAAMETVATLTTDLATGNPYPLAPLGSNIERAFKMDTTINGVAVGRANSSDAMLAAAGNPFAGRDFSIVGFVRFLTANNGVAVGTWESTLGQSLSINHADADEVGFRVRDNVNNPLITVNVGTSADPQDILYRMDCRDGERTFASIGAAGLGMGPLEASPTVMAQLTGSAQMSLGGTLGGGFATDTLYGDQVVIEHNGGLGDEGDETRIMSALAKISANYALGVF